MNTRTKKQLSVLIVVSMLLILLIVAAIILMPSGGKVITTVNKPNGGNNVTDVVNTEKYDFVGRIYDKDMKLIANGKFGISINNTEFTTDANGYFRLNGLPVGVYNIYFIDESGNKVGTTEIQLSTDGCFSVGYVFFEDGKTVTMMFDGEKFTGIEPKSQSTTTIVTTVVTTPSTESEEEKEPEDPTYTNYEWMKDQPFNFGFYGLSTTWTPDTFHQVISDPQYDYINTFIIDGSNLDRSLYEAELLAENGKMFFLNAHNLVALSESDVDLNLRGDWRYQLELYASHLMEIGGDFFQGFYFDEVDLYLNERDFCRVTKYMREHFQLRTYACHRRNPFTVPSGLGVSIKDYKGSKFVIDSESHKYLTDISYWWYGGYEYYGYNAERLAKLWAEAMELLDPNVRKWIVPPMGTFDFRHSEEDCLEVAYAMYREASKLEGFGGLMFYTAQDGGLWGGFGSNYLLDETDENFEKLKIDNYLLKDKDGNYILDENGNKIITENNSICAVRDGMMNYSSEGGSHYWIFTKLPDGTYPWKMGRQYVEIIGNGIVNGTNRLDILAALDKVFKPDYSKYK